MSSSHMRFDASAYGGQVVLMLNLNLLVSPCEADSEARMVRLRQGGGVGGLAFAETGVPHHHHHQHPAAPSPPIMNPKIGLPRFVSVTRTASQQCTASSSSSSSLTLMSRRFAFFFLYHALRCSYLPFIPHMLAALPSPPPAGPAGPPASRRRYCRNHGLVVFSNEWTEEEMVSMLEGLKLGVRSNTSNKTGGNASGGDSRSSGVKAPPLPILIPFSTIANDGLNQLMAAVEGSGAIIVRSLLSPTYQPQQPSATLNVASRLQQQQRRQITFATIFGGSVGSSGGGGSSFLPFPVAAWEHGLVVEDNWGSISYPQSSSSSSCSYYWADHLVRGGQIMDLRSPRSSSGDDDDDGKINNSFSPALLFLSSQRAVYGDEADVLIGLVAKLTRICELRAEAVAYSLSSPSASPSSSRGKPLAHPHHHHYQQQLGLLISNGVLTTRHVGRVCSLAASNVLRGCVFQLSIAPPSPPSVGGCHSSVAAKMQFLKKLLAEEQRYQLLLRQVAERFFLLSNAAETFTHAASSLAVTAMKASGNDDDNADDGIASADGQQRQRARLRAERKRREDLSRLVALMLKGLQSTSFSNHSNGDGSSSSSSSSYVWPSIAAAARAVLWETEEHLPSLITSLGGIIIEEDAAVAANSHNALITHMLELPALMTSSSASSSRQTAFIDANVTASSPSLSSIDIAVPFFVLRAEEEAEAEGRTGAMDMGTLECILKAFSGRDMRRSVMTEEDGDDAAAKKSGGGSPSLSVPDLTSVFAYFTTLYEQLSRSRATIATVIGSVQKQYSNLVVAGKNANSSVSAPPPSLATAAAAASPSSPLSDGLPTSSSPYPSSVYPRLEGIVDVEWVHQCARHWRLFPPSRSVGNSDTATAPTTTGTTTTASDPAGTAAAPPTPSLTMPLSPLSATQAADATNVLRSLHLTDSDRFVLGCVHDIWELLKEGAAVADSSNSGGGDGDNTANKGGVCGGGSSSSSSFACVMSPWLSANCVPVKTLVDSVGSMACLVNHRDAASTVGPTTTPSSQHKRIVKANHKREKRRSVSSSSSSSSSSSASSSSSSHASSSSNGGDTAKEENPQKKGNTVTCGTDRYKEGEEEPDTKKRRCADSAGTTAVIKVEGGGEEEVEEKKEVVAMPPKHIGPVGGIDEGVNNSSSRIISAVKSAAAAVQQGKLRMKSSAAPPSSGAVKGPMKVPPPAPAPGGGGSSASAGAAPAVKESAGMQAAPQQHRPCPVVVTSPSFDLKTTSLFDRQSPLRYQLLMVTALLPPPPPPPPPSTVSRSNASYPLNTIGSAADDKEKRERDEKEEAHVTTQHERNAYLHLPYNMFYAYYFNRPLTSASGNRNVDRFSSDATPIPIGWWSSTDPESHAASPFLPESPSAAASRLDPSSPAFISPYLPVGYVAEWCHASGLAPLSPFALQLLAPPPPQQQPDAAGSTPSMSSSAKAAALPLTANTTAAAGAPKSLIQYAPRCVVPFYVPEAVLRGGGGFNSSNGRNGNGNNNNKILLGFQRGAWLYGGRGWCCQTSDTNTTPSSPPPPSFPPPLITSTLSPTCVLDSLAESEQRFIANVSMLHQDAKDGLSITWKGRAMASLEAMKRLIMTNEQLQKSHGEMANKFSVLGSRLVSVSEALEAERQARVEEAADAEMVVMDLTARLRAAEAALAALTPSTTATAGAMAAPHQSSGVQASFSYAPPPPPAYPTEERYHQHCTTRPQQSPPSSFLASPLHYQVGGASDLDADRPLSPPPEEEEMGSGEAADGEADYGLAGDTMHAHDQAQASKAHTSQQQEGALSLSPQRPSSEQKEKKKDDEVRNGTPLATHTRFAEFMSSKKAADAFFSESERGGGGDGGDRLRRRGVAAGNAPSMATPNSSASPPTPRKKKRGGGGGQQGQQQKQSPTHTSEAAPLQSEPSLLVVAEPSSPQDDSPTHPTTADDATGSSAPFDHHAHAGDQGVGCTDEGDTDGVSEVGDGFAAMLMAPTNGPRAFGMGRFKVGRGAPPAYPGPPPPASTTLPLPATTAPAFPPSPPTYSRIYTSHKSAAAVGDMTGHYAPPSAPVSSAYGYSHPADTIPAEQYHQQQALTTPAYPPSPSAPYSAAEYYHVPTLAPSSAAFAPYQPQEPLAAVTPAYLHPESMAPTAAAEVGSSYAFDAPTTGPPFSLLSSASSASYSTVPYAGNASTHQQEPHRYGYGDAAPSHLPPPPPYSAAGGSKRRLPPPAYQ